MHAPSYAKVCETCGETYYKKPRNSWTEWHARKVCSRSCRPTAEERLWAKVQRGEPDECWPWTGVPTSSAHGSLRDRGRCVPVHALAYRLLVGPIPDGHEIHHRCENPICCNPAHMEPLTKSAHSRLTDGGAYLRAKTHCPQGHPYDEVNTYVTAIGGRRCRICGREASRRSRARRADM